ncbi:MAG TPA: class I tRNA ligase family protein, partial [Myxococcota bacterium]|nr:class I tRNA ligase family protein [Myxococcota bacterium]
LAMFSGQGRDVKFSIPRVIGYRSFLNKVWNATRFSLMNIEGSEIKNLSEVKKSLAVADRYILSRLHRTIEKVGSSIEDYRFSDGAEALYHFFWDEYCDKYIEVAKVSFKADDHAQKSVTGSVLICLLDASMRLLHPFCPFISEEIWQSLPSASWYKENGVEFCAVAPFPVHESELIDKDAEDVIELIFSVSTMIKNGRQSSDLPANLAVPVKLLAKDIPTRDLLLAHLELISHLAKTSSIEVVLRGEAEVSELSVTNSSSAVDTVIMLEGLINVDKELERLRHALEKINKQKASLLARLSNQTFLQNAPKNIVESQQAELSALDEKERQLAVARDRLLRVTNS